MTGVLLVADGVSAQSPPVDSFDPGVAGEVNTLVPLPDGHILVGGSFTSVGGQSASNLARLQADGSLDTGFAPNPNGRVNTLAAAPDGSFIVGGHFTAIAQADPHRYLARFTSTVTLAPGWAAWWLPGWINSLAVQADGRVVVGGSWFDFSGWPNSVNLTRLLPNGGPDLSLQPNFPPPWTVGPANEVFGLAMQPDGRILLGGTPTRLMPAGSNDITFNATANAPVYALVAQPDGRVLVGGIFTTLRGVSRAYLGRLNGDGSLDSSFVAPTDGAVRSLALQADGKIILGGDFTTVAGQSRPHLARLNPDGTLDPEFNAGADARVNSLTIQRDGSVLVGGSFTMLAGEPRLGAGRLASTTSATSAVIQDASSVIWLRGGGSPEVWRANFAVWNGETFVELGDGARVTGGWRLAGLSLAANSTFRLRGHAAAGQFSGSPYVVEEFSGPPAITRQPVSQTNAVGATITFAVASAGAEPLAFRWLRAGVPLANDGAVSGALTATLTLNGITTHAGPYSVVVSNAFGSVTSVVAQLIVNDLVITTQPQDVTALAGSNATFTVTASGSGPLTYQWRKEGVARSGATSSALALTNLQAEDFGDYAVVVSGLSGAITSRIATLSYGLIGVNAAVSALLPLPDGRLAVGGSFSNSPRHFGFWGVDGQRTNVFPVLADGRVSALALQADGGILIGGSTLTFFSGVRRDLARLNPNATLDLSYNPSLVSAASSGIAAARCLALQPDGKALVGGFFTSIGGQARTNLARLHVNGSADTSFQADTDWSVFTIAVQPDGRVLAGGEFRKLAGQSRPYLGRVNPNGTLDADFNPILNGIVQALAVQADGKILVGGSFSLVSGHSRLNLARLNTDGSVDTGFNPGADADVSTLAVMADGRILVGGAFGTLDGAPRSRLGCLHPNGTVDAGFNPGANSRVAAIALQSDGRIVVGGHFTVLNGQPASCLGRLPALAPVTENLTLANGTLDWQRGGGGPEVWRATFDAWSGTRWVGLGSGTRMTGGWRLSGVQAPDGTPMRARGYAAGSLGCGSGYFVEGFREQPGISAHPTNMTIPASQPASFRVVVNSFDPVTFQWLRNGLPLMDGGVVSGATSSQLTLGEVWGADAGDYSVRVSSGIVSATSQVARLTMIDPWVGVPPQSQVVALGSNVFLSFTAVGTGPLTYQWRKDGVPLAGATDMSLALTNFQAADYGAYDVRVTGFHGSVLSVAAQLEPALPVLNGAVKSAIPQPDGKVLLAGEFTMVAGQSRRYAARLNANGTLDTNFIPGTVLGTVPPGILLQPDLTLALGSDRRLRSDGSRDTNFNTLCNGPIYCMAQQADGKILLGGVYNTVGGFPRNSLARLNGDGTVDADFAPNVTGTVYAIALQGDGKVLLGGIIRVVNGATRDYLARLNPDGSLDPGFNPGAQASVYALAVQADGAILVGGSFTTLGGVARNRLGRLTPEGVFDGSFSASASGTVYCLALQADGKILVGGGFSTLAAGTRYYLGRVLPSGVLDTNFNPGASSTVSSLSLQADGRVLVGGNFTSIGGQNQRYLARLNNPDAPWQSFAFESGTLTWLRNGSSPEVSRTTFEAWNGAGWSLLGAGQRIEGGWRLAGVNWPAGTPFRARGYVIGGNQNSSAGIVESLTATNLSLSATSPGTGWTTNREFRLRLDCIASVPLNAVVGVSTNLQTWQPLVTNLVSPDGGFVTDRFASNSPARFYRLLPAP